MSDPGVRYFSAEDVKKALPMRDAIQVMREAFVQLSSGETVVPVRMNLPVEQDNGCALIMPVYLPRHHKIGVKVVSIMNDNPAKGLPRIHALVLVFDAKTGKPAALMDGEYLTALRTGAASGLATDLLARKDAKTAVIFGAGTQARTQLEGICAVRKITKAYVFNRTLEKAKAFARDMSDIVGFPVGAKQSREVLGEADVICTATTSTEPLFSADVLKPGVHINAIGAYRADMCEVPPETVTAAKVVVDHRESCLQEAGDIVQPIRNGLIGGNPIHGELGEIAAGSKPGRTSDTEITLFKSVGNAVQDLAAANRVLEKLHR